ncbi:MAG: hypothetical protein V2I74_07530 [Erythrobacter sp.]|jgi:hypothetical protein|nr:hypothetical protein [Erythrobacter sp.]
MNINLPYIDRIWRASGEVRIDEPLTPEEAFKRLDPLFQTPGTSYAVEGDTLHYSKHNPAAQDKLATFTSGALRVEQASDGTSRLLFHVRSTALLLCFLAPLLFLGFAQLMVTINGWEKASPEAIESVEKKDKDKDTPKAKRELHPIDKFLGAPEPDDPAKKKDRKKDEVKEKFPPTRAYVLAGLFFLIYLVGRVLEPWLLKRTFRAALAGTLEESAINVVQQEPATGTRPEAC